MENIVKEIVEDFKFLLGIVLNYKFVENILEEVYNMRLTDDDVFVIKAMFTVIFIGIVSWLIILYFGG